MKSKGKGVLRGLTLVVLGCVLLAGCEDVIKGPPPEALNPGAGRVVIVIGSGIERTVFPRADQFSKITLSFERKDGTGTMPDVEAGMGETAVSLLPGTWEITASAYNTADPPVVAARAKNTLTRSGDIISGDAYFALAPAGTGPGILRYAIAPPEGITLDAAGSRIRIEQDGEVLAGLDRDGFTAGERFLSGEAGGTVSLEPGRYVADIVLDDKAGINTAVWLDSVTILPGLVTEIVFKPEAGDFMDPEFRAALSAAGKFNMTKNNSSKTVMGAAGGAAPNMTQEFSAHNGVETLYFTLSKTWAQTITLGGEAAGKAKVATGGTVDGQAASPTLAVFTVDTSAIAEWGGDLEFTASLGENGKTPMVYTIAINIASLTYVHVTDWPTKRVYMTGDVFDFAGSQFWGIYSDGEWRLETGGYTPRGFDSSAPGELRVGIEKHGIPAKMYRTTSTSGTLHPGLTKIDFDVVYSYGENFLITVLPSTAKALFFWHGLTADYKPQPKRYTVPAGRTLTLAPAKWYIPDNAVYEWRVDGVIRSGHTTEYFPYTAAASSGEHTIRVAAKVDGIEIAADETTVVCTPAAVPRSKNSASSVTAEKLYSVVAPGQFGSGSERLGELHGFGGFGGYGVFKFDHSVMKQPGGEEMSIGGNAFALWQEPGVIWVSQDDNGNGEPDDTWYELQGSHTFAPTTTRRYVVKYRPDIWINNLGEGDRTHNWQEAETPPGLTEMTLVGTNIRDPGSGIVMWGYADVVDNGRVSLSNAILEDGTPVDLPFIDFVKIVSGQHLYTDMFGEKSTEARTPTDRSMGDLDSHITYDTKVDGGYKYTFTNNSGYDLTIEILEGGETFTLVSGASVVKIIDKTGIYIEYWGGNVKLKKSPGHGSFYDQD